MKSNRIFTSKIYRFLDYALRLVILNLVVIIPSFSFFIIVSNIIEDQSHPLVYLSLIPTLLWLLPSVVSCTDVVKQYEIDKTNTVFKDFFKSLKKVYLKSILLTVLGVAIGYLLINSVSFFYNYASEGVIYLLGLALSISFFIVFLMVLIHCILCLAYFKLGIIETIKLACIMAFKDIVINIVIIILVLLIISLSLAIYVVMITCCFSLISYLMVKLSLKNYIRLYRKFEEKNM